MPFIHSKEKVFCRRIRAFWDKHFLKKNCSFTQFGFQSSAAVCATTWTEFRFLLQDTLLDRTDVFRQLQAWDRDVILFYNCDKWIMPDEVLIFFLTLNSQWKAIRLLSTGQIKTFFHFVYTIYNQTQFHLNFWKFITSGLDMEMKFTGTAQMKQKKGGKYLGKKRFPLMFLIAWKLTWTCLSLSRGLKV